MISKNEFLKEFPQEYLDEITTKIGELIQHIPNDTAYLDKIKKGWHEESKESLEYIFAINLIKLGLNSQIEKYITEGVNLLSNLSRNAQSNAYTRVGDYCLKSKDADVKKKAKKYLIQAYDKWREALISKKSPDAFHKHALIGLLKKAELIEQYQKGREISLDLIQQGLIYNQPSNLLSLADCLIGVEDEEIIIDYIKMADEIITSSSNTKEKIITDNMSAAYGFLFGPTMKKDPFLEGISVFELQLAIAKASKDLSTLEEFLKIIDRDKFYSILTIKPKVSIAKTFYELNEKSRAMQLFQEIVTFLLTKWDNCKDKSQSDIWKVTTTARGLAGILISLNEHNLARELIPILIYKTQDDRVEREMLLIDLDMYNKEDFLKEVDSFRQEVDKTKPSRLVPMKYSVFPVTIKGMEFNQKLSRLFLIAEKLGLEETKYKLFEIVEKLGLKIAKERGKPLEAQVKQSYDSENTYEKVTEFEIMQAYEEGNNEKLESLLQKYEKNVKKSVTMIQNQKEQPPQGLLATPVVSLGRDKELWRFSILIEFTEILLKVEKIDRVKTIIKELDEAFHQLQPMKKRMIHREYVEDPLILFRRFIILKIKTGCSGEELDKLIEYSLNFDPEGAKVIGVMLAERGEVTRAQKILENVLSTKSDNFSVWRHYYEKRLRILRELGEYEEVRRTLDSDYSGTTTDIFNGYIFLGDEEKVIDLLNEQFAKPAQTSDGSIYLGSVKILLKDNPTFKVNKDIWLNAKNLYLNKLLELISRFDLGKHGFHNLQTLIELSNLLIKLENTDTVRKKLFQLISTLQEGIEKIAPQEIKENMNLITTNEDPWDFEILMAHALMRSNLMEDLITSGLWDYYRETEEIHRLKEMYDKLNMTYRRWRYEAWGGNKRNLYLYLSTPYVYESLIEIFEKLGDEKVTSACKKNLEIIKELRLQHVLTEPVENELERSSKSIRAIFWKIHLEIDKLMYKGDLQNTRKSLGLAFKLLDHPGVIKTFEIDKFIKMFGCLVEPQSGFYARLEAN